MKAVSKSEITEITIFHIDEIGSWSIYLYKWRPRDGLGTNENLMLLS